MIIPHPSNEDFIKLGTEWHHYPNIQNESRTRYPITHISEETGRVTVRLSTGSAHVSSKDEFLRIFVPITVREDCLFQTEVCLAQIKLLEDPESLTELLIQLDV